MIKKILMPISSAILLLMFIYFVFPYGWKYFGGTFLWGGEMIYKGKTLFKNNNNCTIFFKEDYSKIELICSSQKRTWIDGKEVNNT